MNVLVFGATGGTGREVVARALAHGHTVTAFARHPGKLTVTHAALRIVRGVVDDAATIASALAGQDAVISALGVSRPLHPDTAVVEGVRLIVVAMEQAGPRRLIYQSFIGVSASRAAAGPLLRFVARIPLRHEIADHERKEEIVSASRLDWTIVRPPKLTDGPYTGQVRHGETIAAKQFFPRLSRADVAEFLVGQLTDAVYTRRVVRLLP